LQLFERHKFFLGEGRGEGERGRGREGRGKGTGREGERGRWGKIFTLDFLA